MDKGREKVLGELIVQKGLVDEQLRDLLVAQARDSGQPLIEVLVENAILTPEQREKIEASLSGSTGTQPVVAEPPPAPPPPPVEVVAPPEPPPPKAPTQVMFEPPVPMDDPAPPTPPPIPSAPTMTEPPSPPTEPPPSRARFANKDAKELEEQALAELVVRRKMVSPDMRDMFLKEAKETHRPFLEVLVENALITPKQKQTLERAVSSAVKKATQKFEPTAEEEPQMTAPAPSRPKPRARTSPRHKVARRKGGGLRKFLLFMLLFGEIGAVVYLYLQGHVDMIEQFIPLKKEPPRQRMSDELPTIYREGDLEAVLETAQRALQVPPPDPYDPIDAEAHYWMGRVFYRRFIHESRIPSMRIRLGDIESEPLFGLSDAAGELRTLGLKSLYQAITNVKGLREAPARAAMVDGIQRFNAGDFKGAIVRFKEAEELDPKEAEARVYVAHAEYMLKRFDSALNNAAKRLTGPSGRDAKVIYARIQQARALESELRGGRDGEKLLRDAIDKVGPVRDNPDAVTAAAEILVVLSDKQARRGVHEDARVLFDQASKVTAGLSGKPSVMISSARVREVAAGLLIDRGQGLTAADELKATVETYTGLIQAGISGPGAFERRAMANRDLARLYASRGSRQLALEPLKQASEDFKKASEALDDLALKVASISAERTHFRLSQERHDLIRGSYLEQIDEIQKAGPQDDPRLRTELGRVRLEYARYLVESEEDARTVFDEAVTDMNKVVEEDSSSALAYFARAEALTERARYLVRRREDASSDLTEALADLERALARNEDLIEAVLAKADLLVLQAQGDRDQADQLLQQAIQSYSDLLRTQPEMALAYARRGRAKGLRADVAARSGRDSGELDKEARKDFKDAISRNAELLEAYALRGGIWLVAARRKVRSKQGPAPEIIQVSKNANAALKVHSTYLPALRLLSEGKMLLAVFKSVPGKDPAGDYKVAIDGFKKVLEINPRDYEARWKLGTAQMHWGEYIMQRDRDPREKLKGALSDLTAASAMRPFDPTAASDRAHAYRLLADFELSPQGRGSKDETVTNLFRKCAESATLAVKQDPRDARAIWDRANALFFLDQFKESIEDCDRVIEIDPSMEKRVKRLRNLARVALQRGG